MNNNEYDMEGFDLMIANLPKGNRNRNDHDHMLHGWIEAHKMMLKKKKMTSDRIQEILKNTAYPQSVSVQQALYQVWNEIEQSMQVKE